MPRPRRRLDRELRHLRPVVGAPPKGFPAASAPESSGAGATTTAKVERLRRRDLQDLLDLVTVAFAEHGESTPRQVMKPHVYRANRMHEHWGIRERGTGRLLAVAGVTARTLIMGGGSTLKAAGIGGVAVHPRLGRKQGLMTQLMDHAIADLKTQGFALAMLSGLRQRYAYFGFEKAGQTISLTLTSRNFELGNPAAVAAVAAAASLQLCPMEPSHLPAARALHAAQTVCWGRHADASASCDSSESSSPDSEFMLVMSAWNARPYVALDHTTGDVVGYLVGGAAAGVQGGGRTADPSKLQEVVGCDSATTLSIVYAWVKSNGTAFSSQDPVATMTSWDLPAWQMQDGLGRDLLQIAEASSVATNSQFLVLDWVTVVNALLALQASLAQPPLPCGRVVVAVSAEGAETDVQQRIALEVSRASTGSDSGVEGRTVGRCTAARDGDRPDIICSDALAATRLLLGHTKCAYVMDLGGISASAAWLLDAWCPLPLHWNRQDAV